ncbi:MAG: hypothetical protein GX974_02205 [Clostridiales bacterium]|nr:hypothetical protein [Clostridiales bacterium]
MLEDILKIINRDGYISRSMIASELNIPQGLVDDGIGELLRMGHILEEETGEDCVTFCANCPFAKNCSKEIVQSYKISDKGKNLLKHR